MLRMHNYLYSDYIYSEYDIRLMISEKSEERDRDCVASPDDLRVCIAEASASISIMRDIDHPIDLTISSLIPSALAI